MKSFSPAQDDRGWFGYDDLLAQDDGGFVCAAVAEASPEKVSGATKGGYPTHAR
jgi:hypothetical protein